MSKVSLLLVVTTLAFPAFASAQNATPAGQSHGGYRVQGGTPTQPQQTASPQPSKKLTNQDIIDMATLKLSDDVILDKIQSAEATDFDTSVVGLKQLKANNVSDAVIRAMINPHTAVPASAASVSTDSNSPDSPHEPGIYLYSKGDSGPTMSLLEPTIYTQAKTSGFLTSAITYGAVKIKWKASISGAKAHTRSTDPSAVFYLYFEKTNAGLSYLSGATSPNEFSLLRLDAKADSRETVVMKMNAYGSSSGNDEKKIIAFDFVKLRPGVYKVTPEAPLVAGEYGIIETSTGNAFMPGTASANRVFDFGIDKQR